MLYGLQGNTGYGKMNTKLLAPIPQLLAMCNDDFQSRDESTALYGLQGMSSDSAEVRGLISVLVAKVKGCKDDLSAQAVGNALYGIISSHCLSYLDSIVDTIWVILFI